MSDYIKIKVQLEVRKDMDAIEHENYPTLHLVTN
jgi:hypothetical protein